MLDIEGVYFPAEKPKRLLVFLAQWEKIVMIDIRSFGIMRKKVGGY
ncbi:hypothetical protein GCM10007161_06100 [Ignatzschineria indica]|nr:hypothetical protein GCM10007161_06100 [Ignatzschineria indica]